MAKIAFNLLLLTKITTLFVDGITFMFLLFQGIAPRDFDIEVSDAKVIFMIIVWCIFQVVRIIFWIDKIKHQRTQKRITEIRNEVEKEELRRLKLENDIIEKEK